MREPSSEARLTAVPGASDFVFASMTISFENTQGAPARTRRPSRGFKRMVGRLAVVEPITHVCHGPRTRATQAIVELFRSADGRIKSGHERGHGSTATRAISRRA